MPAAYYNENDPYAAEWLRNLIAAGEIPDGDVDERSIVDVRAEDLDGYGECHFFAGIGGWSLALGLAGWPEARPVWTGSVPCQPLSSAGQRKGHADERHLWPAFHALIAECRPATVLGEQVASKDGREWLAGVRADLEDLGYAVGAADLCAAGVGAPDIRQRLWWVADADGGNAGAEGLQRGGQYRQQPQDGGPAGGVADAQRRATERHRHEMGGEARKVQGEVGQQRLWPDVGDGGADGGMADAGRTEPPGRNQAAQDNGRSGRTRRIKGREPSPRSSVSGVGNATEPRRAGRENTRADRQDAGQGRGGGEPERAGDLGRLGNASGTRSQERGSDGRIQQEPVGPQPGEAVERAGDPGGVGITDDQRPQEGLLREGQSVGCRPSENFWSAHDLIPCADGRSRRVEPRTFPLAARLPLGVGKLRSRRRRMAALAELDARSLREAKSYRIGSLRGYGNSINPYVAAEFIRAFLAAEADMRSAA